jgi:hypothetical protein
MRLGIRYLYSHARRRYMPNGDDLYRHPTTLFGRIDEPFAKLQNRIDTLMMEAVIWGSSWQPEQAPPKEVDTVELKRHQQVAEGWLSWIIANREDAAVLAGKSVHEGASLGAKQKRLNQWYVELERVVNGEDNLDFGLHSHIMQDVDDDLRKEIEDGSKALAQSSKRGENQQPESQPANGNEKSETPMDTSRV